MDVKNLPISSPVPDLFQLLFALVTKTLGKNLKKNMIKIKKIVWMYCVILYLATPKLTS